MKSKPIKIAALVPQLPEDAVLLACHGMLEEAARQQVTIHFFNCSYVPTHRHSYILGEKTIFSLPNLTDYNGFLLLGNFFDLNEIMSDLRETVMTQTTAPIVAVNYTDPFCTSVTVNHFQAMHDLTRHFIDVHHFKRFCYLTGPMDQEDSSLSYHGFLAAIKEAGSEVSPPKIYYNVNATVDIRKAADSFLENGYKPQVILCSDNTNALYIFNQLSLRGYRVPEDISVACFSGVSKDHKSNLLTSVTCDCRQMGSLGVKTLIDSFHGVFPEKCIDLPYEIFIGQSCSCKSDPEIENIDWLLFNNIQLNILKTKMLFLREGLCEFTDLKESIFHIAPYLLHLRYIKTAYLCLCSEKELRLSRAKYHETYTPHMILRAILKQDTSPVFCHEEFIKEDLLPPDIICELDPSCLSFFPLHYKNHCLGYLALHIIKPLAFSFLLRECLAALSLSLELIYKKDSTRQPDNNISLTHDYLCDMDNLLGFETKSPMIYQDLHKENTSCYLFLIALDNLQKPESTCDFIQRDQMISALSQSLHKVCAPDMLCARINEKCFCVLWGRVNKSCCDTFESTILHEFEQTAKIINHLPTSFLTASIYTKHASTVTLSELMEQAYSQLKSQMR